MLHGHVVALKFFYNGILLIVIFLQFLRKIVPLITEFTYNPVHSHPPFVFVCLIRLCPSQQFFSYVGMGLPGSKDKCAFMHFCLLMPCGHLLGKGWPLGSPLWCLIVTLSLSHWYPRSGVVLDCIDSWSLPSFLLCSRTQHSNAGEAQPRGLWVSSQALYHWATALPFPSTQT